MDRIERIGAVFIILAFLVAAITHHVHQQYHENHCSPIEVSLGTGGAMQSCYSCDDDTVHCE